MATGDGASPQGWLALGVATRRGQARLYIGDEEKKQDKTSAFGPVLCDKHGKENGGGVRVFICQTATHQTSTAIRTGKIQVLLARRGGAERLHHSKNQFGKAVIGGRHNVVSIRRF